MKIKARYLGALFAGVLIVWHIVCRIENPTEIGSIAWLLFLTLMAISLWLLTEGIEE